MDRYLKSLVPAVVLVGLGVALFTLRGPAMWGSFAAGIVVGVVVPRVWAATGPHSGD